MPEKTFTFTGWNAVIVGIVLLAILISRLMSFGNNTDPELREALLRQLNSEFYPNQVSRMEALIAQQDSSVLEEGVGDVLTSTLDILSVQTSYPFLDFSSPRIIIVKVTYDLGDNTGFKKQYYRYKYGMIGNSWQYQRESNVISYYLNFM